MGEYKSKVNSYNTPNGVKWRVEYAYKTPDGVYHRSCKRGFDTEKKAELWEKRELYKLIDEKEREKPPVPTPAVIAPAIKSSKEKGSYRDIHLPQILVDELQEYVNSIYGLGANDYIFNLSKSSLHRELDRCIAETGIPDITVHGFRHSANALLSNVVKCPDVVRKYRLGHCDETTNDIYNHPYKYSLEEVATKLNELMEEIDNVSEEY